MKIGKVYANAEREEDRADQTLIEMGAVVGEGLLGALIETIDKLVEASADQSYYGESGGIEVTEKVESAWLELFTSLKAIEAQSEKVAAAIEDARLAMTSMEGWVPARVVNSWLAHIEGAL